MSNVTLIPILFPGQVVRMRGNAKTYEITTMPASNARNVKARDEFNRPFRLPILGLEQASKSEFTLREEDITSKLFLGTIVRFKNGQVPGKMVVVAKTSAGNIRIAKLGGDRDRYYTAQAAHLALVEDDE